VTKSLDVSDDTHLKVLAEHAAQVTSAEEYGARPTRPPQAVFLAEVWKMTADAQVTDGAADRELVSQAVDVATPRAERAVAESAQGAFDTISELT
jgi:hypothetical protein